MVVATRQPRHTLPLTPPHVVLLTLQRPPRQDGRDRLRARRYPGPLPVQEQRPLRISGLSELQPPCLTLLPLLPSLPRPPSRLLFRFELCLSSLTRMLCNSFFLLSALSSSRHWGFPDGPEHLFVWPDYGVHHRRRRARDLRLPSERRLSLNQRSSSMCKGIYSRLMAPPVRLISHTSLLPQMWFRDACCL